MDSYFVPLWRLRQRVCGILSRHKVNRVLGKLGLSIGSVKKLIRSAQKLMKHRGKQFTPFIRRF